MNVKPTLTIWFAALVAISAIIGLYSFLAKKAAVIVETKMPENQPAVADNAKRILAIHSYNKDFDWVVRLDRGFNDALSQEGYKLGENYSFEAFYMDTKATYTKPEEIQARAILAEQAIKDYDPDIIFITDDNALTYVGVPYAIARQNEGPDFIFAGINSDPTRFTSVINNLEKPGKRITGALERMPVLQGLTLAKRMFPTASRAVILSDKSESSDFALQEIRSLLSRNKSGIEVKNIIQSTTFDEWKKAVRSAQKTSDLIITVTYHQLRDSAGNIVPPVEVVKWTTENNKLPELGTLQFHAEDGFLMAIGVSGYRTGRYAGELATRLMAGEKAGEIPIIDPERADISFNLDRAGQLGIQIPVDLLGLAAKVFQSATGKER